MNILKIKSTFIIMTKVCMPQFSYRYPSYQIFSDSGISSLANKQGTRYSADSLSGVIFDVTILSECDYIVCTFSSQVRDKHNNYVNNF